MTLGVALVLAGCGAMTAGTNDAGTAVTDGGSGGFDGGVPTIHGCTAASYVDRRTGSREIGFGTALNSPAIGYSPSCMIISAGQSATFVGSFNTHPLVGGQYMGSAGTTPNPIGRHDTGSANVTVTFAQPGLYPFYCDYHAPSMVGAISVQ